MDPLDLSSTDAAPGAAWAAAPHPALSVPAFHGGEARRQPAVSSSLSEEARGLLSTSPHIASLSAIPQGSPDARGRGTSAAAGQRSESAGRAVVDMHDATRRVLFEVLLVSFLYALAEGEGWQRGAGLGWAV